jgi:hypothetical protein
MSAASGSIQVNRLGDALKIAFAALREVNIRSGHQILHSPRHEALTRLGLRCDARSNMHGNATHIALHVLDLTGMKSGADFYSQRPDCRNQRQGAMDRSARAVERCQKTIAGRLNLSSPISRQFSSKQIIVRVEQFAPTSIA